MTMMRCSLLLAWCLAVQAAELDPDAVIKLATERVVASAAQSYTCVETIVREYYWPMASTLPRSCPVLVQERQHPHPDLVLRHAVTDRLHLEVAMTGKGEIFSWVGAPRFDDAPLHHIVDGPIMTGAFAGFLSVVFKQDVKNFNFERSRELEGRSLMEYSFRVAAENSSYRVMIPGSSVKSGYSGTVLVDAGTGEVAHLTVNTDELPPAANACEISMNLDLNQVKIGDGEFLLPARGQQRYVLTTGEEVEITTAFAACREYLGESSVSFTAPQPGARGSPQKTAVAPVRVPGGQQFTLELTAPIASLTAAAGDEFSGRLVTPLRDEKRRTLARAGSLVEGHLLRVERRHLAPASTVVVFRPESVEIAGSPVHLAAVRDWSRELVTRRKAKVHVEIQLPLPTENNAGVFRFDGAEAVVPRGYRSAWRTVDLIASPDY
jgi:hypothetical protein